jgi:hypothetical protein
VPATVFWLPLSMGMPNAARRPSRFASVARAPRAPDRRTIVRRAAFRQPATSGAFTIWLRDPEER